MEDLIVNFDEPRERANFHRMVDTLAGMQRVTVKRHRKRRSNPQNAFYWAAVLPAFVRFRHEQGEEFDEEMAHAFFKMKFLRKTVVDKKTGEAIGSTVGSTATLDREEFSIYLEKIMAWMSDYGISVPPARHYAAA